MSALLRWDVAISSWFRAHATPAGEQVATVVSYLGYPVVTWLAVAIAVLLLLRREWLLTAAWIAATAGGQMLESLLKGVFSRQRPPFAERVVHDGTFGFPSGHAMQAAIVYLLLAFLIVRLLAPTQRVRWSVFAAAVVIILAVGVTRVYLGAHYPLDVAAGFFFGAVWAGACLVGYHFVHRQRLRVE